MSLFIQRETVEAAIGFGSLVGVLDGPYPLSFGNYFGFRNYYRCVNMWAENLEEWAKRNDAKTVEVISVRESPEDTGMKAWCLVQDPRIPNEWINRELCFTGTACPDHVHQEIERLNEEYWETL